MQDGLKAPIHGNREVVRLLETWLAKAREGDINHVALTVCGFPNLLACDFAGAVEMELFARAAVEKLKEKLEQFALNRAPPPEDPSLTADYVCYNLAAFPISYDFITWLVNAEMTRIREKAPAPLKIAFSFGKDYDTGFDREYPRQMMSGVVYPSLKFYGVVEDPKAIGGRCKPLFVTNEIAEAARNGEEVPRFKPSESSLKTIENYLQGQPVVTITLREAEHWPHRNSNIEAWTHFAHDLETKGHQVVFVRDTAKAMQPLLNYATCPRAAVDLDLRLALYESAKVNLFVSNGPFNLGLYGTAPWICFQDANAQDSFYPNSPEWWNKCAGINIGDQYPWSYEKQKLVWAKDTYENISKAWEEIGL